MLFELRYLHSLQKHDRVLFPICQVRRDLLSMIASGVETASIDRRDYIYARWMLESLNSTIALYRDYRTRLFNFREYTRFVRRYRESAEGLASLPTTKNQKLKEIEERLDELMFRGFLTYTPLMRSEMVARMLMSVIPLVAKLGLIKFAAKLEDLKTVYALLRSRAERISDTAQFPIICS
jgi:hypothetical protein